MFDLVFLGTAAAVPSAERGLPALVVGRGPERFLVDCGEGTQRQLLRAGLGFRGLAHVLLTHAHLDHVAGLAGLVATRALWGLHDAIEIVGSEETVGFVRRYLAVTVGGESETGYRLRAVGPGPVLAREGWRLDAFAVAHRGHAEPRLPLRRSSPPPAAGRSPGSARRAGRAGAARAGRRAPGHARRRPADRTAAGAGTPSFPAPSSRSSAMSRRWPRSPIACAAPTRW